jgi:transcriptional regulator with XRE-family HTH domain
MPHTVRRMTTTPLSTQATFSELLRRWRRNQGLSQRDFGELLDPKVRHSTVSCWESDVRRPSLKFLGQIVAITGIPAHLALGIDGASQEDGQP